MPISNEKSYFIRILDTFNDLNSQILKDIQISQHSPNEDYNVKAHFYNESVFLTFDTYGKKILVFMIRKPFIVIPSLTKNQYKEIYKQTGSYIVNFYLNVSNQFTYAISNKSSIFRGKIKDDGDYDEEDIPSYIYAVGCIGFVIILTISTWAGYKIYKRCGKKEFDIDENEAYSANRVEFIFSRRGLI